MRSCATLTAIITCCGLTPKIAHGDDGSWSRTYDLAQGPLYTVKDNPDVSLERELLVLEDYLTGRVIARFEFRNTSDRAVTLEAGFPVELDLSFHNGYEYAPGKVTTDDERGGKPAFFVPFGKYGGTIDPALLRAAGLTVRKRTIVEEDDDWDLGELYVRGRDFPKKRRELPVPKRRPFDFTIEQDGKAVTLTSMVVELDSSARPPIVFHFRHKLSFAPGATSIVTVTYQAPTLAGGDPSSDAPAHHQWSYVLRTGATWKGPLGKLVVAVPSGSSCPSLDKWSDLGKWAGFQLYGRSRFEPTAGDDIDCRWKRGPLAKETHDYDFDADDVTSRPWPKASHQAGHIKAISASSAVKYVTEVYTADGVVTNVPNSAAAAFDGIVESAWSEGKKGAGVGEYLELELTQPAVGVRIMPGFIGALHPAYASSADKEKRKLMASLYHANSRPKLVDLVAVNGSHKWRLAVADRRGEWSEFPILIPPGQYRLVIAATYPGKRWQDTAIGEVEFITSSTTTYLEELRKDSFFGNYFADRGEPQLRVHVTTP